MKKRVVDKQYSQDIKMKFGLEKYAMLIMRSGKKTNNERNRYAKSRKNRIAGRKEKITRTWAYLKRKPSNKGR